MLKAVAKFSLVALDHAESNDHDLSFRQNLVDPAVKQRADFDIAPQLFVDLTCETRLGCLARLPPAAGQFPFGPFILEQNDGVVLKQDALDRDGKFG